MSLQLLSNLKMNSIDIEKNIDTNYTRMRRWCRERTSKCSVLFFILNFAVHYRTQHTFYMLF